MARSVWKLSYKCQNIFKKTYLQKFKKKIRLGGLWCRSSIISNIFYKKFIFIHKGNLFNKLFINKFQLGFKLGEFSFTRKPFSFTKKKKKINFIKR